MSDDRCVHGLLPGQCFFCKEAPVTRASGLTGTQGRAGRPSTYSAEEDELILAFPAREAARALGRPILAISARKQHLRHGAELNLRQQLRNEASRSRATEHGKPWSEWEDELVLGNVPIAQLADRLGRTLSAVMNRRSYLRRERGDE